MIKPPDGDIYVELPDGFEATAHSRYPLVTLVSVFVLMAGLFALILALEEHMERLGFAIVFLIVSLALKQTVRLRLRLQAGTLRIFTGIGRIGWSRRYPWDQFHSVEEIDSGGEDGRRRLVLRGGTNVELASLLDDEHRYFILQVLQRELAKPRAETRV